MTAKINTITGYSGELMDGLVTLRGKRYAAYQFDEGWIFCKVTTRFVAGNDLIAFAADGQCYRLLETEAQPST